MSDSWTFSSSSPPLPIIHHSSLSQPSSFISSPPPLSSPPSPRNHGHPHCKVPSYHLLPQSQLSSPHYAPHPQVTSPHHLPHSQVTSPQYAHPQVTSPHLPHSQVTSPQYAHPQVTSPHLPHSQVTSPQHAHSQVTSPHHFPHSQVTSPHHFPHSQVTSPHHFPHSQVTSPHLPHSQVTSPHYTYPQVTSPHHFPHSQVTSPHYAHPQVTSPHHLPHPQVSSPHLPHPQVTSPHFSHPEVTSPYLPHPQVTSSHHLPHPQVTSPHLPHPQVTSPHLPHTQVTSPHHAHPQVTSPHLPHPQVTSPHHAHPQVTSPHLPHPQVTSPHHAHPQVTSPHLPHPQVTSPHLPSPSPHHLYNPNHDPGLDSPDWSRCEAPSDPSCLLKTSSFSYQNQTPAHLDLQIQIQSSTHDLDTSHRLHYNTHTVVGVPGQDDSPGPGQDTWRSLCPSLSQLQCSPLGSVSADVSQSRWSSIECSLSPADFGNAQFFHNGCHDSVALQPFCSPNTPGPSPHYPQTPTISSPGPQIPPREERPDFHTQTPRELSRNKPHSFRVHEYDSSPVTSDPGQLHPAGTGRPLLQSQSDLVQDQTSHLDTSGSSEARFPPQGEGHNVGSTTQSAGLDWCEERGRRGGRGRGRGGGGAGGGRGDRVGQPDWTWMKQTQLQNSMKVLNCRLLCTVCKRDFKSLPALNGHMRSHSGSRSSWLNKDENSFSAVHPSVSMVMPVSVPIESRGVAKACRAGQRRSSRLSPATRGAVLYHSLLRLDGEAAAQDGGGDGGNGGHYTPPPMLCPLRAGQGLYCSLTTRRQQRVQTVQLHNSINGLDDLVAMETASPGPATLTGINKARINVGRGFQAEIPPLLGRKCADSDSHNALLQWTPWNELECPVNQQRVEALLMMVRSSVVPGGGARAESALHVLLESRGDFLLTVEKLLSTPETSNNHTTQQSASWSATERKLLVKSLQLHHKDFSKVQKVVQTKTVSQCVEFYYLWKKKLSLRTPAGLTVTLPDTNGQRSSRSHDAS